MRSDDIILPEGSGPADQAVMDLLRATARSLFATEPSLRALGEAGFMTLLTVEAQGGAGWLPVEASLVAEEAGRALSPLPWAPNLVAAATLSAHEHWHDTVIALMDGTLRASVSSLGPLAIDRDTGHATGRIMVSGDDAPDLIVCLGRSEKPLLIDCRSQQIAVEGSMSLDTTRPVSTATLNDAVAHVVGEADGSLLCDVNIILACADSLGALTRAATFVKEHLVARVAFGRQLASFQVIQHRLADLAILEAACAALLRQAFGQLASTQEERGQSIAATHSYFCRHIPAAIDDCIQLAGGIGFTWECSLHHAMRRTVANSHVAGEDGAFSDRILLTRSTMDVAAENHFRTHARNIIRHHAPGEMREGHRAPTSDQEESALRTWYRTMYENQLLGASWPTEWGGTAEHQSIHELIVTEELILARAPRPIDQVNLASHVLLNFGNDAQKNYYLPRIRSAEHVWCQLFSEPDCGSDLAGIKARAELGADGRWTLSGQKTWTTDGHWAQMGLALLRTSTGERRHDGITAFLVPMDAPSLEVQPKLTIGGAYEFNDVFLDGVVLGPEQVIGPVGGGWSVAMSGLEIERFGVGGNVLLLELLLSDLVELAQAVVLDGAPALDRADIRHEIALLASEGRAAQAFVADHVAQTLRDRESPADASIAKVLYSETYNSIARYGSEFVMAHLPVPFEVESQAQHLMDAWLWSRALTISGGTSEVMRNIIAKRRLRLPQ
jgi:alkylation response protein AidB-like acyl-CoA dehydrogenase